MSGFGKAIWVHLPTDGPDAVRGVAKRLDEADFDVVIPCLKTPDGYTNFQSRVSKVRPVFADWDPLAVLCDEAGKVGLKVHGWICTFPEGEGSKLLDKHPEFTALNRQGQPITGSHDDHWACPARPEVHEHELALYQEVLDNYDVAAVHMDYIRFCDADNCFCPSCRAEFQAQFGADPVEIGNRHQLIGEWIDWRACHVTRFVEQVRERANRAGKQVSAAVLPDYPLCVWTYAQDWESWARRGLVDMLMPMSYSPTAAIAAKRARNHLCGLGGAVPAWEGLNFLESTTTAKLVGQIEAVLTEGAPGVTLFEYTGLYGRPLSDDDIKAIQAIGKSSASHA